MKRVESTSFATRTMPDEDVERFAVRLGVQPDVLVEARVRAKLAMAKNGVAPPVTAAYQKNNLQLILCFAREPWEVWSKHVEDWGVDGGALLRALLHAYLLGSYEPEGVLRYWLWEGRRVAVVRGGECRTKTFVTRGARNALTLRARMRGCANMALMRALVMENIAGKFGRRGTLRILDARAMYDDETRYFLGGNE